VGAFYPTPGFCDELMVFYRLEQLTRLTSPVAQDADEQIEPRTFALDEARALLQHSEYADMKTTLALTLV
jgi:hypothetical protein